MIHKLIQLVAMLVLLSSPGRSVPMEQLHAAKRQTMDIRSALQRNIIPNRDAVDSLDSSIDRICNLDSSRLPLQITSRESWRDELAKLSLWYQIFRVAYDAQCSPESLGTEFRRFSTSFHLVFCDYFLAGAPQQKSVTLLLFAPSISCECTMRMSMEYERLLDSVMAETGNSIDLIIIDTVFKQDLCSRYGITDVPAVVLLDRENKQVHRWVREQAIGDQVKTAVRSLF